MVAFEKEHHFSEKCSRLELIVGLGFQSALESATSHGFEEELSTKRDRLPPFS